MSISKWISEGIKFLRISKSITGIQDVQARFLGTSVEKPLPKKPKRPLSSFEIYCLEARNDVQKQHLGLKPADIRKILKRNWNQLPETQRKLYSKNFEAEMSNYWKEMANYMNSLTPEQVQQVLHERNLKRQESKLWRNWAVVNKTKRPSNPFTQYLRHNVPKGTAPDEFKDAAKQLAVEWRTLTEQEKEPFVKKYEAEKEAYEKSVTNLEQKMLHMVRQDVDRLDVQVAGTLERKSK